MTTRPPFVVHSARVISPELLAPHRDPGEILLAEARKARRQVEWELAQMGIPVTEGYYELRYLVVTAESPIPDPEDPDDPRELYAPDEGGH